VTVKGKEENFFPNYVQEFGLYIVRCCIERLYKYYKPEHNQHSFKKGQQTGLAAFSMSADPPPSAFLGLWWVTLKAPSYEIGSGHAWC
jgi:hypothetical protein